MFANTFAAGSLARAAICLRNSIRAEALSKDAEALEGG
jgi:hypothetical protein